MWLILAFASAMLLGFYDVFKKVSLAHNAVIPVLLLNTVFCSLIFLPLVLLSSAHPEWAGQTLYIPLPKPEDHLYIILKSAIVLSSWICAYFGLKHLPITIASPINASRPILVLVGAIFVFGEVLNGWQWAGVLLSIGAFGLLSVSGKKEGINFKHDHWIWLVVLGTVLGAISGLYDKYLMQYRCMDKMTVQSWYNFYQVLMMGAVTGLVWWPNRRKTTPFRWKWSIPLISIFLSVADFCYFYALSYPDALISVVSLVRRSGVIVGFISGWLFFKEKNILGKSLDLLLVILAMVLLWIGTTTKAHAEEVSGLYNNMPRSLQSPIGPEVRPDTLTSEYMRLQVSEVSRLELLVETTEAGDTVVFYLHTVAGPVEDTHAACYTAQWQPLPTAQYFQEPTWRDFLRADVTDEGAEAVRRGLFPMLVAYAYDVERHELTATLGASGYLPEEQWQKLQDYLRTEPLRYRWDGTRMARVEVARVVD
jgi:transporter family protein